MSLRANFLGYAFDITPNSVQQWGTNGLQVAAKAMYSVSDAQLKRGKEFLDEWDTKSSYMIGLYVWATQAIEVFYTDDKKNPFQLIPDPELKQELNEYFGSENGKTWIGLVPPDQRRREFVVDSTNATVAFDVTVKISPAPTAQFIPFVARYRFDRQGKRAHFKDGFMPGMWRVPRLGSGPTGAPVVLCDAHGVYELTTTRS